MDELTTAPKAPESAPALTPLQRAFLALEQTRGRLAAVEAAAREPIAVIGLGCRTPGGARDAASFWQLMLDETDAISQVPAGRWDHDALYDPNPDAPGRVATRHGGFLDEIDTFDPGFFGIAPREAQGMDPQQRLLLEVAWEALEHAGQAPDGLEGSATGAYFGVTSADYAYLQLQSGDTGLLDAHFAAGIAHSIFSGRLSYLLGLNGPSLTIDTACSSSLVAVHLACQALRNGECRMALAGGVNLMLAPDIYISLSRARMLAPDGRCKTFAASADGFARGEGCGVVVLKKLSDAQADGDRVLAVIRGSALNQDGASGSLTAPSGPAQEAVIREALARAGVTPNDVGFIEAHGTGTQLGDPLEVRALGAVFGPGRDPAQPLLIGSVKTNVGHLEGAAGITGLIKLVLSLQNRTLPAHLHFDAPSPHIDWAALPLKVPTRTQPFEPINGRRIAGISAFGFSGTNAHIVLEEAPAAPERAPAAASSHLLALSAQTPEALKALAARYADFIAARPDLPAGDICRTANGGRAHFAHRATLVAGTSAELGAGLAALSRFESAERLTVAALPPGDPPRIAFLFTGQGVQYPGMAKALYDASPVFRATLDRCADILAPHLEVPLLEVIFGTGAAPEIIHQTAYTQPALFAVEYALAELWRSLGVKPDVVMGHSVGEYVAACVAGVFSLDDGLRLMAARGRLIQSLPAGGAMAAIFAPEPAVLETIASQAPGASIAAVNGPLQTVISGPADAVKAVVDAFAARGVRCQNLPVSHAFHSSLMDPILDAFEDEARAVTFARPKLRLISNVTGLPADAAEIVTPAYWRRHLRQAVRFGDGLASAKAAKIDICVEIGPHPTLLAMADAAFGEGGPRRIASLVKGKPDWEQVLSGVASAYLAGVDIKWAGLDQPAATRITDLPTYPFQRERYWFQAKAPRPALKIASGGHPLLGTRLRTAGPATIYEQRVSADQPGYVRQHRVLDHIVLPATAYLDTLAAAARTELGTDAVLIEDVAINAAMFLDEDGTERLVQTVLQTPPGGVLEASINSLAETAPAAEPWLRHVTARLRAATSAPAGTAGLDLARAGSPDSVDLDAFYADFERLGLHFGPDFRSIAALWRGPSEALGEIRLLPALSEEAGRYGFHPVLLDGCLQVIAAALPELEGGPKLHLPIGIGAFALHRAPAGRCFSHVTVRPSGELKRADIAVYDAEGTLCAEVRDVQLKPVDRRALDRLQERWLDDALFEVAWREVPVVPQSEPVFVPASLSAIAGGAIAGLAEKVELDAYDVAHEKLESLCVDYVRTALSELGWAPQPGESVEADALAVRLGIIDRHRQLFGRLLAILGEGGLLARDGAGWRVVQPLGTVDPAAALPGLIARHPQASAELELTGRVGGGLAGALRGTTDPAQLLFPGGSTETTERLYRDSPTARMFNGLMAELLGAASAARAQGRTLRILEVGAGTGGTTAHVLPRLPEGDVEYTFTDIGPLFVARARQRFGAKPFMRFDVLDLERDVAEQGFTERRFDIIIASNVIHATADLRRTLTQLRALLAPGGLLTMLEVTEPQRWFDLTVGLTTGWWAFTDTDLRTDYPTITRPQWLELLGECGFDQFAALPAVQPASGSMARQSIFLARAGAAAGQNWLILADEGGTGAALAAKLAARGERSVVVRPGAFALDGDSARLSPETAQDYRSLLAALHEAGRYPTAVVHAWSLDTGPLADEGDLAAAEARGVLSGLLLAQALVARREPARLWFLTRGARPAGGTLNAAQAPIWGLGKALNLEHPELRTVCLDLDPQSEADVSEALLAEFTEPGTEAEVALREGTRRLARLAPMRRPATIPTADAAPWRLVPATRGSLQEFRHEPITRRAPGPGEIEIEVAATSLNFKDVLNVLGMYPGNPGPLGGECAGRVVAVGPGVTRLKEGDAVLAVVGGAFASHVTTGLALVQKVPDGAGWEEAASFPIPFVTADFCLSYLGGMKAGDTVLIHAAAGGVGMAAVRLAQRAGATVFATAGSDWKRQLLRDIGVEHVFDSRSDRFADEILAATQGRGVDIVLNSLSGDLIEPSFRVVTRGGSFVEIGKRGIKTHEWVAALDRAIAYHIVDWGETAEQDPALVGGMLERLVEAWRAGELAPLPRHVFEMDDAPSAFRFMAQAGHAGKIVLRNAGAVASVRKDGSYLVTGGLAGLGLVVAKRLAEQGAGRLVLIGRRGVTPEANETLDAIRALGTAVVTAAVDVSDAAALEAVLHGVRADGPPLRGVVHSAGLVDDAGLLQQDAAHLASVFGPKVRGTVLLDRLTRGEPLDWFVLFSSAAAILGSAGQANHSAANAFIDQFAQERRARGLPALAINWGAWSDIGAAAGKDTAERLAAHGLGMLSPAQGLAAFEMLLASPAAQAVVLPMDWPRYLVRHPQPALQRYLSELAGSAAAAPATASTEAAPAEAAELIRRFTEAPGPRRRPMLLGFVRERALKVLGMDPARSVDPRTPFGELGLDSLLSVELRNTLCTVLDHPFPATLLFDYPTIDTLTDHILDEVLGLAEKPDEKAAATPSNDRQNRLQMVEELADDELDRMIAARVRKRH
ncbi:MAG TPA: SDR family NAD(P)-dependent oxidoreductase [Xanthobacteraceae bacterium]|nr:SDR family NAD(P)-dependent oxidoreductase [Xanthobacteraceae bacterium]